MKSLKLFLEHSEYLMVVTVGLFTLEKLVRKKKKKDSYHNFELSTYSWNLLSSNGDRQEANQ